MSSDPADGSRPGGDLVPEVISGLPPGPQRVWVEIPRADGDPGAWCYSDRRAYRPGETVHLHLSATCPELTLRLYRDGSRATPFRTLHLAGVPFRPVPDQAYSSGCAWPVTTTVDLPTALPPGPYLVEIRNTAAGTDARPLGHHFFVVRGPGPRPGALVQVLATCTWSAYNDFGGANHYFGRHKDTPRGRSPLLSTQRPWARGQVWLPEGAPRMTNETRPTTPRPPRYHFAEWAYLNGYAKYYAAAGWASFERLFFRWAEAQGYEIDLLVQEDLEEEPAALAGYPCAVFAGHDEYWTSTMRARVDEFVHRGGRVARFAGNFMWQIRIERGVQVAYKYDAATRDPQARSTEPARMTAAWEDPAVGNPGATTFGVNALRGLYAGFGGFAPRSSRGFTVFRPHHWALRGTGLGYGDVLGDEAAVFSYEVDGLDYEFRNGLPHPTGTDGAPPDLEILAMNFSTAAESGRDVDRPYFMLGDGDARYRASLAGQRFHDDDWSSRGAGMVVSFRRGEGEVFTAGTCEWVHALELSDPYVCLVTRTVLDRFSNQNNA